jgi:hypothetical protein
MRIAPCSTSHNVPGCKRERFTAPSRARVPTYANTRVVRLYRDVDRLRRKPEGERAHDLFMRDALPEAEDAAIRTFLNP